MAATLRRSAEGLAYKAMLHTCKGFGYPPCKVTPSKLLTLGLIVASAILGGRTASSGSPTRPSASQERESTPQHTPNEEAIAAYQEGETAYQRKDMANAARAYESAVKIDPSFGIAWLRLGRAKMFLRQPVQAEAAFQKFLELSPDDPDALANLAWALTAEKKYGEAIDVLKKQLAIEPNVGDVYQRIGDAYMQMK